MAVVFKSKKDFERMSDAVRRVEQTPKGSLTQNQTNQKTSNSNTVSYVGKITGGTSSTGYSVDIYSEVNGTEVIATGTVFPVMLHIGETLSVGTWVVCVPGSISNLSVT